MKMLRPLSCSLYVCVNINDVIAAKKNNLVIEDALKLMVQHTMVKESAHMELKQPVGVSTQAKSRCVW